MNSLLTNLIPQKFKVGQNYYREIHVQKAIPTHEGSKFELDCVVFKSSYILMIDVISFKLRLINFVYFFETQPVVYSYDTVGGSLSLM